MSSGPGSVSNCCVTLGKSLCFSEPQLPCDRQLLMSPNGPCILVFPSPRTISSPWLWAGLKDPLLVNRIWPKGWDVTPEIRLQKVCGFHLGYPLSITCLFTMTKASCHVIAVLLKSVNGKKPMSLTQHSRRAWDLPIATQLSLKADPPQVQPWDDWCFGGHLDCILVRDFESEVPN